MKANNNKYLIYEAKPYMIFLLLLCGSTGKNIEDLLRNKRIHYDGNNGTFSVYIKLRIS